MSLDDLRQRLDSAAGLVLEEAVPVIATALEGNQLYVPLTSYDEASGNLQLLTGQDVNGAVWLYAYTGEDVMIAGGLAGKQKTALDFLDIVRMAKRSAFAGIVIDMAEGDRSYDRKLVTAGIGKAAYRGVA